MLVNIPTAIELNEIALRLYFDAWDRTATIASNFKLVFDDSDWPWKTNSQWADEWNEYLNQAQSELGAIAATAQQSAEVRLKSIICETDPYILLLKSDLKIRETGGDLDFADQRTLDAVDLPAAVRTLTPFPLPQSYIQQYQELRRLRNKVMHTGMHQDRLEPQKLILMLSKQYVALWPDGRWLSRRVDFDGNSATAFFHDERWSSVQSEIMEELPITIALFDNELFRKCVGTSKSSLKGYCPCCKSRMASKLGADTEPTVSRKSDDSAKCYMCEVDLGLTKSETGCNCGSHLVATASSCDDPCCFDCGQWNY